MAGLPKEMKRARKPFILLTLLLSVLFTANLELIPDQAGRAGGKLSSSRGLRWGLNAVQAPEAWKVTQGSESIVVAVIDSGVDGDIEAMKANMWENSDEIPNDGRDNDHNGYVDDYHGWDFREDDDRSYSRGDLFYHGTFVAGLVASSYKSAKGAGGVAPKVKIMDLRFLDSKGKFYTSDWRKLAEAIRYAADNGAQIINLSIYASLRPPYYVHRAVREAERKGALVVGIAGNEGKDVSYLGRWKEMLTVGAIDRNLNPAYFSNRGPSLDFAAPGVRVVSLRPGGRTSSGSGTSFAAPHVSGTAALLLSLKPDLSPKRLRELLADTAQDLGRKGQDDRTGYGLVDADRAVRSLKAG